MPPRQPYLDEAYPGYQHTMTHQPGVSASFPQGTTRVFPAKIEMIEMNIVNAAMDLLSTLPHSMCGRGPFHPTERNASLEKSLEFLLTLYPDIPNNPEYFCLLKEYAGYSIYWDNRYPLTLDDHRVEVYGYDPSSNYAMFEEENLWVGEYFMIGWCMYVSEHSLAENNGSLTEWPFNSRSTYFALRLKDPNDPVVYYRIPGIDERPSQVFAPYAGSVTDWLLKLFHLRGRCPNEVHWAQLVEIEREKHRALERISSLPDR